MYEIISESESPRRPGCLTFWKSSTRLLLTIGKGSKNYWQAKYQGELGTSDSDRKNINQRMRTKRMHFHVLVEVSKIPSEPMSDDELWERAVKLSGETALVTLRQRWNRFMENADEAGLQMIREFFTKRMWNVSEFIYEGVYAMVQQTPCPSWNTVGRAV